MTAAQLELLYRRYIEPLSEEDQLLLLAIVAQGLASSTPNRLPQKHSVLEFAGVGKDDPVGMDAQEYVHELRKEWDEHP